MGHVKRGASGGCQPPGNDHRGVHTPRSPKRLYSFPARNQGTFFSFFSFPRSAWERTSGTLCVPSCEEPRRRASHTGVPTQSVGTRRFFPLKLLTESPKRLVLRRKSQSLSWRPRRDSQGNPCSDP